MTYLGEIMWQSGQRKFRRGVLGFDACVTITGHLHSLGPTADFCFRNTFLLAKHLRSKLELLATSFNL